MFGRPKPLYVFRCVGPDCSFLPAGASLPVRTMVEPLIKKETANAIPFGPSATRSFRLPLAGFTAILLTAVIFAVDTFTSLGFAVAVLCALIVMLAASFLGRRGILIVAGVCIFLTIIDFFAGHGITDAAPLGRAAVSSAAVISTTVLTLRNIEKTQALAAQAALLDLTHDTIFTRTPNDIITYWNRGAEALYSWAPHEAGGRRAGELLQNYSLSAWEEANAILLSAGRWEGEMQKTCRSGEEVQVTCRWSLQQDRHGGSLSILETHNDVTARVETELALDRARAELLHVSRATALGELTASIPCVSRTISTCPALRWSGLLRTGKCGKARDGSRLDS